MTTHCIWLVLLILAAPTGHAMVPQFPSSEPPEVSELAATGMFGGPESELKPGELVYEQLIFRLKPEVASDLSKSTDALLKEQRRLQEELKKTNEALERAQHQYASEVEGRLSSRQLSKLTDYRQQRSLATQRLAETNSLLLGMLSRIQSSQSIAIHEGVPRSVKENELAELRREGNTVQHHGFAIYAEPLTIPEDQRALLLSICLNPQSYRPYGGPKMCGGFHPDIMIEADQAFGSIRLFICLGCHEVLVEENGITIKMDIQDTSYQRIHAIAEQICARHSLTPLRTKK